MGVVEMEAWNEKTNAKILLRHRGEEREEKRARGKHGQHWRINKMRMKTSITVVGRRLQTKMRLCDPLGGPPTRVHLPSFPVASAREVPPRGD